MLPPRARGRHRAAALIWHPDSPVRHPDKCRACSTMPACRLVPGRHLCCQPAGGKDDDVQVSATAAGACPEPCYRMSGTLPRLAGRSIDEEEPGETG